MIKRTASPEQRGMARVWILSWGCETNRAAGGRLLLGNGRRILQTDEKRSRGGFKPALIDPFDLKIQVNVTNFAFINGITTLTETNIFIMQHSNLKIPDQSYRLNLLWWLKKYIEQTTLMNNPDKSFYGGEFLEVPVPSLDFGASSCKIYNERSGWRPAGSGPSALEQPDSRSQCGWAGV